MDTAQDLHSVTSGFYTTHTSLEDGRLKAHRIEFEVTLRTMLEYLPARPAKVLDVGGGTGPYSFALASKGHDVTLVDVSSGLLSVARARAEANPDTPCPTRILEGNALSLDMLLPGEAYAFELVLLLSPLYHTMSSALRENALRQAWDMVAPGGTLVCAWVSRWAHYRDVAMREPGKLVLKREFYLKHAMDGDYVKMDGDVPVHAMNHEHPANMPAVLRRVTGEHEVTMVGAEGVLAGGLDKLVNELEGDVFEAWVQKCLEVGRDEVGWQMSDHILGIACKTQSA